MKLRLNQRKRTRGKARKRRGQYDRTGYIYPPVRMNYWAWTAAVAGYLELEAEKLPAGKTKRGLLRRAEALRQCGTVTKARYCGDCGVPREESGVQSAPARGHPCNTRSCALCGRRRAQVNRRNLAAIIKRLPRHPDYGFKHIVVQIAYDPRDPQDVTVDAIRDRAKGGARAMEHVWRTGLRRRGAGIFWALEVAGGGYVHIHALFFGPFLNKEWLEAELRAVYPRIGRTWIEDVPADTEATAPLEVAKYACKAPSPLSEEWIQGTTREVTHPVIAARWEVAMLGVHVQGRKGAFRGLKNEEDAVGEAEVQEESEIEKDADVSCACCGVVGNWHWALIPTREFVRYCHSRGKRAFARSRWRSDHEQKAHTASKAA